MANNPMKFDVIKTTVEAKSRRLSPIKYEEPESYTAMREDDMKFNDSWVLRGYTRAWRMWNTWLEATEREEIEFEQFLEQGFTLQDRITENYGYVTGLDNGYDVAISEDTIHISFQGKPRYTWFPCVPQMGNLKHEEDKECRVCERSWLKS